MTRLVVIVEDTDSIASSLALALESIPEVKVVVTNHPQAALRLFNSPEVHVAAMVTDFNLPSINGFELIGRVRALAMYKDLPAIMITAEERVFSHSTPQDCRPNVILRKPFSLKEVRRVVESLLQ